MAGFLPVSETAAEVSDTTVAEQRDGRRQKNILKIILKNEFNISCFVIVCWYQHARVHDFEK